jgi:hypothetical protein
MPYWILLLRQVSVKLGSRVNYYLPSPGDRLLTVCVNEAYVVALDELSDNKARYTIDSLTRVITYCLL